MQRQEVPNSGREATERNTTPIPTENDARDAAFRELRLPAAVRARGKEAGVEIPKDLERLAEGEKLRGREAFTSQNVTEIWNRAFSFAERYAEQHGYSLRYEASGIRARGLDAPAISPIEFQTIIATDRAGTDIEVGKVIPEKEHHSTLHSSAELFAAIVGAMNERLNLEPEARPIEVQNRVPEVQHNQEQSSPKTAAFLPGYASETQHTAEEIRISFPGQVPGDLAASKAKDPELYTALARMEAHGYRIASEQDVKRPPHLFLMDRNGMPVQDLGCGTLQTQDNIKAELQKLFGGLDVVLRDGVSHEELAARKVAFELAHGRSSGVIKVENLAGVGEAILRADDKTSHFQLEYERDERGEKTSTILLTVFDKTVDGSHLQTVVRIPKDGPATIEPPRSMPFETPKVPQPRVISNLLEQDKPYLQYPESR